jgi:hypothetical protein
MENDDGRGLLADVLSHAPQAEPEVQSQAEESTEPAQEQTAQEEQQEVTPEPTVAQNVSTPPAMDPMAIKNALLEALVDVKKASDGTQPSQQPAPEMSEEDLAREQLKKHLGLDKIEQENSQLKAFMQQMQEQMAQKELDSHIGNFKGEYGDEGEKAVLDHLNYLSQTNPAMAKSLDNPEGWRLIADAKVGKKAPPAPPAQAPKPDPLVSSNSGTATDTRSRFDQLRNGSMSKVDQGNLILSLSQNRG